MRYRFGSFELDTQAYRLLCAGHERKLQPKVFDVLAFLVEHRGRVVSKQELLEALWPGEHVGDATVTWSVSFARRALDQQRADKLPIETVHGRGYRFIAEVETLSDAPVRSASQPPATTVSEDHAPRRDPRLSTRSAAPALPFVGRQGLMQRLLAQLDEAERGRGRVCLLVGEAGIGKTRCAEELVRAAEARGLDALSGRSVELGGAPVLYPWRQLVRELGRKRSVLEPRCEAVLTQLRAYDDAASPAEAESHRFSLFDALTELLREAALQAPLLLVLDDLHWSDASTLEALAFVAPELTGCALLIVATHRDEPEEHNRRAFARLARVAERLSLAQLSSDDVAAYFAQAAPKAEPSQALCEAVQRATAGTPLFVQELVRSMLEAHGEAGLAQLDPATLKPPPVARDVLRAPLAALDPQTLELLACASVLGDAFDLSVVQHLTQLDVDVMLDRLEEAVRRELVVAEAPHRYRFRHVLVRAIVYDDLPASRRLTLHRRAAEWLAAHAEHAARPSEIALHYYRSLAAGDPARVADAAQHAARSAERLHAYEDAAVFYDWALQARALDASTPPRARAELLLAAGAAQRAAGRDEQARSTLARMIDLAREHGFGDLLVRAARALRPIYTLGALPDHLVRTALEHALRVLPDAPSRERVSALSQLACVPPIAHDLPRSKVLSADALALARQLPSESDVAASLLEALRARMYALSGPGDHEALLAVCDEALALDGERTWMSAEACAARLGTFLARGDAAAADAALGALERITAALRRPEGQWYAARLRAQGHFARGEYEHAAAAYDALLTRSKHIGLSYGTRFSQLQQALLWRDRVGVQAFRAQLEPALLEPAQLEAHNATALRARLLVELDQLERAHSLLDALAAQDFQDIPKESSYLSALGHLATVALAVGDRARAERLRSLLAPYADLHTLDLMLFCHGPVALYLAELHAFLDAQSDVPRALFERAIAASDAMDHKPHVARACHAYARWLAAQPSPDSKRAARASLERAHSLAQGLGMHWLGKQTHDELEGVSA